MTENVIQIIIYIHAALGGIALLAGLISLITKKGSNIHKKSGIIFFYAMIWSATLAMFVAVLPNHQSPFLFAIGVFSLYFVISGKRALNFKRKTPNLTIDKWISRIMLVSGILMVLLPIILTQTINIVLLVFGIVGILFSIRDLLSYKNPEGLRRKWLQLHLGKIIGGYISAATAFVVVNEFFPSIYGWFVPSIFGTLIIVYWIRKLNKKPA